VDSVGATHVILPPVLGTSNPAEVRVLLEEQLGCTVIESLGVPPSVPGMRLQSVLERMLTSSGGVLLRGHTVVGVDVSGDTVKSVVARTPHRRVTISASSFVLATGKFIGGGIVTDNAGVREALLGLPVVDGMRRHVGDDRPTRLTSRYAITEDGHPLYSCGVSVDEYLRPVDLDGTVQFENLYCAGAVVSGHNYPVHKDGLGVALVTGHAAGVAAAAVD